jgi:uncharacterized Ntn-hydrolase superfamily protein
MVRLGTYSIVARDPSTGELGAAVQSHWFSVGSVVNKARAGVGAVCTQSLAEPAYAPRLLDRMEAGEAPGPALAAELAADEQREYRQVAAVSATGEVAVHTGLRCMGFAGDVQGEQFSCQANLMSSDRVWGAMAEAFTANSSPPTPLARRMFAALEAGEAAGGDVRGRQSAALVVAPAAGESWRLAVDLRIEDHEDPLAELGRLLDLHEAYTLASDGDDRMGEGRHDEAGECFRRASALAPDNHELLFWSGMAMAHAGHLEDGVEQVRRAIAMQPGWAELLPRLGEDLAPAAPAVRKRLAERAV